MEMHQVRYFLAACETLNFTRAAERCNVSQPALTKAVKKLEDELGGLLFRRERNQTHLTDLGRMMVPHFEQMSHAVFTAKEQASKLQNMDDAPLRLGVMCTIGPSRLLGFLSELRETLPQLELSLCEAPGHALIGEMMSGELDLALIGLPVLPDRFTTNVLFEERFMVAFAAGHPFEAQNAVTLRSLKGENYLARSNCEFAEHREAADILPNEEINIIYESEREDWIQALVSAGHGCTVIPEFLVMAPDIVTRPLVEPEVTRQIKLASIGGRRFSPAARAFMDCCNSYRWDA
jgi:DNA-binding transcriptional LysR family regulator